MGFLTLVYNLSWLFIILVIRDNEFYFNPDHDYFRNMIASLFAFVGLVTTTIIVLKFSYFKRSTLVLPIFIFTYFNLLSYKYILRNLRRRASHLFSDSLIVASAEREGRNMKKFAKALSRYGYNVRGYLESSKQQPTNDLDWPVFGNLKELPYVLNHNSIDELFIDMSGMDYDQILQTVQIADSFGVRVKLIPANPLLMSKNYKPMAMGDLAVFKLRQSPLDHFSTTILKRLFDVCFALLALVLLTPVYLIIALLVKFDSKGSVLYAPYRKGEAGKTFKCYKFRTMKKCEDPLIGASSTVVGDERITRIGKYLRKMDLDELPQFYNVLIGDMSVIGPRPHRVNLQKELRDSVPDYMVRSYVKPGITGWAQVNGWRGPTVSKEQKNERINHDLWYIENWSLWLDIKIVFMTIFGNHRKKAF